MPNWISVADELPESYVQVLAVKELKSGERDICIAYCVRDFEVFDVASRQKVKRNHWVCGGNNNIIYWMPLPEIPKD